MRKIPDEVYADIIYLRRLAAEYDELGREADAHLFRAAQLRALANRIEASAKEGTE